MFSALSEKHGSNLSSKINLFIAMAPITNIHETKSNFLKDMMKGNVNSFFNAAKALGITEIKGPMW
jgi:hypothetical protein